MFDDPSGNDRQPVCLPRLGLAPLFFLRAALGRNTTVYYDTWPLYGKGLMRWFRIPERWLTAILSAISGIQLRPVAETQVLRGSPQLNLRAMKQVVTILQSLREQLELAGWIQGLSQLLGPVPALAYYYRRFPSREIWPASVAAAICKDLVGDRELILAWSPDWPESWRSIAEREFRSWGISFFSWPTWYSVFIGYATNLFWIGRVILSTLVALLRQGCYLKQKPRQTVQVAIEFIDYTRLEGNACDTNYFEDGTRLKRQDILYFLTREQHRLLTRHDENVREIVDNARARGFRLVELSRLKYSLDTLRFLATTVRKILGQVKDLGAPCLAHTFWRGWLDFLSLGLLFDSFHPRNYLHTMAPNGHTALRLDSAVATSLCRRFGCRSVGYQNRSIYDSVYEDCFDCYDIYLAWGEAWRAVLGSGNEFIDQIVCVGCHDNDGLFAANGYAPNDDDRRSVAVFPSDLGGNLYPRTSTLNLLETCIELAKRHRNWKFRVKMKDPGMVDVLLSDESFAQQCETVKSNFEFLRLARYDCATTICESDIVIGAAWTTPATDALILGKRIIYYDDFDAGGAAFAGLPDMIARSRADLVRLFEIATSDYKNYATKHHKALAQLDPFRDNNVKERILDVLLADDDGENDHTDARQIKGRNALSINQIMPLEKAS